VNRWPATMHLVALRTSFTDSAYRLTTVVPWLRGFPPSSLSCSAHACWSRPRVRGRRRRLGHCWRRGGRSVRSRRTLAESRGSARNGTLRCAEQDIGRRPYSSALRTPSRGTAACPHSSRSPEPSSGGPVTAAVTSSRRASGSGKPVLGPLPRWFSSPRRSGRAGQAVFFGSDRGGRLDARVHGRRLPMR
jgi:hypothetical protein